MEEKGIHDAILSIIFKVGLDDATPNMSMDIYKIGKNMGCESWH